MTPARCNLLLDRLEAEWAIGSTIDSSHVAKLFQFDLLPTNRLEWPDALRELFDGHLAAAATTIAPGVPVQCAFAVFVSEFAQFGAALLHPAQIYVCMGPESSELLNE